MTNTTNTELKPCPFCGQPGFLSKAGSPEWFSVGCSGLFGCPAYLRAQVHRTESAAIAAWNTRAALAEAEGQAVPQSNLELAAAAVAAFRHRLSYNYSYTGEPAGLLKTLVADLDRALSNQTAKRRSASA